MLRAGKVGLEVEPGPSREASGFEEGSMGLWLQN